jgi:outer membrane protein assembly factor BamB/actin-like ATPase involved in cell morphogenesis
MGYGLGVDLGTTHTAAAVEVAGRVEAVRLGSRRPEIPSVVFLRADGDVLVGEAALRRGEAEPGRLAREFKRRLGDPVPIILGGAPLSAHALTARLLRYVVEAVTEVQEAAPERIVITHPANWGPYKRELLAQAVQLADVGGATLRPEPEAAAVRFAGTARVAPGEIVAVYDLGGGTFDAAVLRKLTDGFSLLGETEGIEQLGGIDFDEAVFEHVRAALGDALDDLDPGDEALTEALVRLRRDCVEAKESLSYDTEAVIAVALPRLHTRVRISRAEFEAMIAPALEDTVAAMQRALNSAGVAPDDLRCIVLAGGSARIPLVGQLLADRFGRPVSRDEQPELGIALGAAQLSGPRTAGAPAGPEPAPGAPNHPSAGPSAQAEPSPSAGLPAADGPAADQPAAGPSAQRRPSVPVIPARRPGQPARAAAGSAGMPTSGPPTGGAAPTAPGPNTPPAGASGASVPPGTPSARAAIAHTSVDLSPPIPDPMIGRAPVSQVRPAYRPGEPASTLETSENPPGPAQPGPAQPGPGQLGPGTAQPGPAAAQPGFPQPMSGAGFGQPHPTPPRRGWRTYRWPLVGGIVAVVIAVTMATAWPDSDSGPSSEGGPAPVDPVPVASVLWRAQTGEAAAEPPAVTADRVFVGGVDGVIRAFRRSDGSADWSLEAGTGVAVSTRVVGNVVYATTADGDVLAVDGGSGEELWRRRTGTSFEARPVVGRDRVFAGGQDAVLYAYELAGNHRRWRVWTGAEILTSPTVVDDVVVVASSDGRLYGADNTGRLLWKPEVGEATGGVYGAGDAACVPVDDGSVPCVLVADGTVLSRVTLPGVELSSPVGGDGVVYAAGSDGTVGAWETHTGAARWKWKPAGGGPAVAGFLVVRGAELNVVYPDGRLFGLDAATGAQRWETALDDSFATAPRGDEAALFVAGRGGTLHAVKPPTAAGVVPAPVASVPRSEPASPVSESPSRTAKPTRTPSRDRTRTTDPTPSPSASEQEWPPITTPPTTEPTDQSPEPPFGAGNDNGGGGNNGGGEGGALSVPQS